MRLLLDENISPRLLDLVIDLYLGSQHVRNVGLASAQDEEVWAYASREGFTIVSKDTDFRQRSFLLGAPPKVVWIRLGNCSTEDIAGLLRQRHADLLAFDEDTEGTFLALG